MSLTTLVLSEQTASTSLKSVLEQAGTGGVEVRSADGKLIAFVLPPDNEEAWAYAEASIEIWRHRDEIVAALERRTGVTTEELLSKAEAAGKLCDLTKAESLVNELFREHKQRLTFSMSDRAAAGEAAGPRIKSG